MVLSAHASQFSHPSRANPGHVEHVARDAQTSHFNRPNRAKEGHVAHRT
jgi:hypothetical protein